MARMEKIGCFGLTEPLVGSGTGGGLTTTAKREGDTWVLNGQKRWIGNAPWCDISIIWARDLADNQVKGFIVENKTTPGFSVEKIQNKIALKVVQNGQITLKDCRVPEANRLQLDKSFRDTARVLRLTRYLVGWEATGCQMGAYEHAVKYAQERLQFGKPIGSFQLVQDLLAKMLSNITACQCMVVRTAQLDAEGKLTDQHAALAKAFTTTRMRETVAWARELLGGNGIVVDYNVARYFADAEALYSYEGTYQMQHLIVGKGDHRLKRLRVSGGEPPLPPLAGSPPILAGDPTMASAATTTVTSSPTVAPAASTATLALANVLYEKRGGIAYATVNRPKVLNALNSQTWKDLRAAFEDARAMMPRCAGSFLPERATRRSSLEPTSASSRMRPPSTPNGLAASDRTCSISSEISASRSLRLSTVLRWVAAARRRWPAPSGSQWSTRSSASRKSSSDSFRAAAAHNDCRD